MTINYVNKRSELTKVEALAKQMVFEAYRVRTCCDCKHQGNRRTAIIVIDDDNRIFNKTIRCKACAKKEVHNDTL